MQMSYLRFFAMIAVSTVAMFVMMYLNTYQASHLFFSQTRMWMALLMGTGMAIIMLGLMWGMYPNKRTNLAITTTAAAVFLGSVWLVRSQDTVDDISYMKAMIPHHSIAVMTSERAHIRDPEVRSLADKIIESQVREIAEMKQLIARLELAPVPDTASDLPPYRERGPVASEVAPARE